MYWYHMKETTEVYERFAENYQKVHADRSRIANQTETFLELVDENRVLNVGCGPGWESEMFGDAGYSVVGIDLAPSFLAMASERASGAAFLRMDMRSLGFKEDSFDGVWACASLHNVSREWASTVFSELHRVLRPDGVLVLTYKRGEEETTGSTFGEADSRRLVRYAPDELREFAIECGFEIDAVASTPEWNELHLEA